jgi:hypothetical protein
VNSNKKEQPQKLSYEELKVMAKQLPVELLEHIRFVEYMRHRDQFNYFISNKVPLEDYGEPGLHPWLEPALAEGVFNHFGECAQKDPEVATRLHYIAKFAALALFGASRKAPKLFQAIARNEWVWPILACQHPEALSALKEYLCELELGKECGPKMELHGKRPWSAGTVETGIAFRIWQVLEGLRQGKLSFSEAYVLPSLPWWEDQKGKAEQLPPLTRATSGQWWKVAEFWFEHKYGQDFENHADFEDYWDNDSYKEPVPGNPRAKRLKKNARALIRRDIKAKIKQSFRSIARRAATAESRPD